MDWPARIIIDTDPGVDDSLAILMTLARLERRHPKAVDQLASLVVMGGAVNTPGNVTPHAEFNFYSDPIAAQEVLATGVLLTLVDLDACRQVSVSRDAAENLRCGQPLGLLVVQLVHHWFQHQLPPAKAGGLHLQTGES